MRSLNAIDKDPIWGHITPTIIFLTGFLGGTAIWLGLGRSSRQNLLTQDLGHLH